MRKPSHEELLKFFLERYLAKEEEKRREHEVLLHMFHEATGGKDIIIRHTV